MDWLSQSPEASTAVSTVYTLPLHTTASLTDADTYFPAAGVDGGWINTRGADSVTLITRRTAETGTCTLQAFVEFLDDAQMGFLPLLDLNNATAVQGVQYANSEVDTSTPFHRFLLLNHGPLQVDADTIITPNTVHKAYQIWLPERIRIRFRHGGTTVTNTFSATLFVHSRS